MRIIFLMVTSLALHGCATGVAGGYGQGGRDADGRTYQVAREDNRISAAVNSALVRESLPAMAIDVYTRDGVVTLRGEVSSRDIAQRAVAVARGVQGVREVNDLLRIAR